MESPSHQPGAVTGRDIIVSVVFHAILFVQGLVAGPTSVNHTYLVGPPRHRSKVYVGTVFISSSTTRQAQMRGFPRKDNPRGITLRFICYFAFLSLQEVTHILPSRPDSTFILTKAQTK